MKCKACGGALTLPESAFCETCVVNVPVAGRKIPVEVERPEPLEDSGYNLGSGGLIVGGLWILLHLTFYFLDQPDWSAAQKFWPLQGIDLKYYDSSELVLYILLTVPGLAFANLFYPSPLKGQEGLQMLYDTEYKEEDLYTPLLLAGFNLFVLGFIFYVRLGLISNGYRFEREYAEAAGLVNLLQWGALALRGFTAYYCAQMAKKKNREETSWAVFGLLLPALAILSLTSKRKYRD